MSNGIIDRIIDQESLDQLLKLQQLLNEDAQAMQKLIDKSASLRKELGTATNMAQLNEQLEKQKQLSKEVQAESKKEAQTMSQLEKLRERLAKLSSQEAKEQERLRQAIADKNRELRNAIRSEGEAADSIKGMSGRLNLLRQEYEKLSKAQRESAQGQELQSSITALDQEYKDLRGSMGQFQANVGDYQGAILRASGATEGFTGRLLGAAKMVDFNILKQKAYNVVVGQSTGLLKGLRIALAGLLGASIIGGIILLIANWDKLKDAISGTTKEQKLYNEIAEKASEVAKEEGARLEELFGKVNRAAEGSKARKDAIDELNETYGDYLPNLLAETSSVEDLKKAYDKLTPVLVQQSLLRGADAKLVELGGQRAEKLVEIAEAQRKLNEATAEYNKYPSGDGEVTEFGNPTDKGIASQHVDNAKADLEDYREELTEIEATITSVADIARQAAEGLAGMNKGTNDEEEGRKKREAAAKKTAEEAAKTAKEAADNEAKLSQKIATATEQLAQLKVKAELDALSKIANSENASYNARMQAAGTYNEEKISEINRLADKEVEEANGVQALIDLANEKRSQAIEQANQERTDMEVKAAMDRSGKVVQVLQEQLGREEEVRSQQQSDEETALAKQYASGAITREQYEKGKLDITRKYAVLAFEAEIDLLEATLNTEALTTEQRIALTKQLADARAKYAKHANEVETDETLEAAKKQEDAEKRLAELRKQLLNETVNLVKTAITSSMEARIEEYDQQIDQVNTEKETRLAALEEMGMSEARRAMEQQRIEEEAAAKAQQLEEQKRQAEMRKAKFDKASAVFEAAINTGISILASSKMGFPMAIPFIAMAAALGTVQMATILAQKPPKYKEGTPFHRGGLAVLGDGGVQEGVILPGGKTFASADTPTLYDLPRGTKVLPEIERLEPAQANVSVDFTEMKELQVKTIKAIKENKATQIVSMDARGVWSIVSNNAVKTTALNRSIRKR